MPIVVDTHMHRALRGNAMYDSLSCRDDPTRRMLQLSTKGTIASVHDDTLLSIYTVTKAQSIMVDWCKHVGQVRVLHATRVSHW